MKKVNWKMIYIGSRWRRGSIMRGWGRWIGLICGDEVKVESVSKSHCQNPAREETSGFYKSRIAER